MVAAIPDASEVLRKEIVNLHRVVRSSKLGKHITKNILIPILEKLDPIIDGMVDWIGFLLQDEIHYLLSTASPSGFVYKIYYVDPTQPPGQKATEIGEYEPSLRGGPPKSPKGGGGNMPQSGTLYQSIIYTIKGSTVILGIQNLTTPYALWYNPDWPGKLFHFADNDIRPGRTSIYGPALDNPSMFSTKGEEQQERSWGYRPFWRSAMDKIRPEIKRRFREEFSKALQEATRRPTVKRAIGVRFYWRSA